MKQADKTYVKLNTRDFSTLAICAVRYSLGRLSYMPSLVCEIIKKHIDEIDSSFAVYHHWMRNFNAIMSFGGRRF